MFSNITRKDYQLFTGNSTDIFNIVKAEFIAVRLAELAGIRVAPVCLKRSLGKDILLVERFDRRLKNKIRHRRSMVSALTILGLDEMMARYAGYEQLAVKIWHQFSAPK